MEKMSFVKAVMTYFGRLPGQSAGAFSQELKALTTADREWFKREFKTVGIEVVD